MNSKERIKTIFNHKLPDRIGVFDFFDEITVINWTKQGLLPNSTEPSRYFDFDIDFRAKDFAKNKFIFCCLDGPFEQLASSEGLQHSLVDFVREPRHVKDFFKVSLNNIYSQYKKLKEEGHKLDGIWLCEDIAYDNGLYFSLEKYKDTLYGLHSEISSFFKNEKLPVVFHCDGNVERLIPLLAKANFSGIHPLQEFSNPNIIRIKKDFKAAITFIGGIGLNRIEIIGKIMGSDPNTVDAMSGSDPILDRILELKEDGDYIFSFDGPIPHDIDFKAYQDLLTSIEAIGAYTR